MVAIVGTGNVASHLYKAFKGQIEVVMINPHTLKDLPKNAEIIIISVKDDTIKEVSSKIPKNNGIVVHTAGSVSLSEIHPKHSKRGVFYPLQTFSKETELNYEEIPVFIEGEVPDTIDNLKQLASLFSKNVREIDSDKRALLHLASVFACNFTNALAGVADNLLKIEGMDLSVLMPLMKQTIKKLETMSPEEAQTGPAVRKDVRVLTKQMNMLQQMPLYQKIYSDITDLIWNTKK